MSKKSQVLLLKPLQWKGNAGDIIDVKMHYANYVLIPQGIAVNFDKQAKNQHEAHKKSVASYKAEKYERVQKLAADLKKNGITYEKNVTETGSLYDSISNKTVLQELKNDRDIVLANESLVFEKIESIGEYDAVLTYEDIVANFKITVKEEEKEE